MYEPLKMIHNERSLVFETINGKQLQFFIDQWDQILISKYTPVQDNHSLCYYPQREEKIWNLPFLYKEPEPSDLKLQETFSL